MIEKLLQKPACVRLPATISSYIYCEYIFIKEVAIEWIRVEKKRQERLSKQE